MSAATYAHLGDLAAAFRPLTEAELGVAGSLLTEASVKLRSRVPGLDAMVAADADRGLLAKAAVVNAVKRVLLNPSGMKQRSESAGVFSASGSFDDSGASGSIEFTDADLYGLVATSVAIPGVARARSGYPPAAPPPPPVWL
jgi:hypothetical protein